LNFFRYIALTVEALQGKTCQDFLLSGEGTSLGAKISGGRGRPWGICFGFYKTIHILLSDSANCIVLRAIVLTQYRRVTDGRTDGQTDGIAVASTALAMRRAVKSIHFWKPYSVRKQENNVSICPESYIAAILDLTKWLP